MTAAAANPQGANSRPKQKRYQQTRVALLSAARQLFSKHGYNGTHTEQLVAKAGLTRGALYYHFRDKAGLFEAVFEELALEVRQGIRQQVHEIDDPWEQLLLACRVYLELSTEPAYQKIALQEAMSVIGWNRWSAVMADAAEADLVVSISKAMKAGYLPSADAASLSRMLAGAFRESAFFIANSNEPWTARRQVDSWSRQILNGLRLGDRESAESGTTALT